PFFVKQRLGDRVALLAFPFLLALLSLLALIPFLLLLGLTVLLLLLLLAGAEPVGRLAEQFGRALLRLGGVVGLLLAQIARRLVLRFGRLPDVVGCALLRRLLALPRLA